MARHVAKSSSHITSFIIPAMIEADLIEREYPDTPRDPRQRYRSKNKAGRNLVPIRKNIFNTSNYLFLVIFLLSLRIISPLMNVIFADNALEELYATGKTKDSRYKKLCRNKSFIEDYIGVVDLMFSVDKADDLKNYSYLHYEKLKYRSESSVRIDNGRVERLIFTEHDDGIEVRLIEIDSAHYGNKR